MNEEINDSIEIYTTRNLMMKKKGALQTCNACDVGEWGGENTERVMILKIANFPAFSLLCARPIL